MALKKSELYGSLWASCDELRGGMDASQYKDYVLVLLFIKYVSDKYAGQPYAPITVPKGASFKDMVALKGKSDIGDQINKKIIGPLANANKLSDFPDFNDATKLGSGKEMVDRLTNLVASSRIRRSTSPRTVPKETTSSGMPMSTSCGTSPRRAARAKANSIRPQKSVASSRRSSAFAMLERVPTRPFMTRPAVLAHYC